MPRSPPTGGRCGRGRSSLRHDLYQVDPLLRRTVTFGLLSAALLAIALGVTAGAGLLLGSGRTVPVAVVVTALVGLAVNPLYLIVRRGVDRMQYGHRGDPYTVLAELSRRLAMTTEPTEVLGAVAAAATGAVRSPYAVVSGGPPEARLLAASSGQPTDDLLAMPLTFRGATTGQLRVAPRSPGEPFDERDRHLLAAVAAQAGAGA